jgi:hypothetical protein
MGGESRDRIIKHVFQVWWFMPRIPAFGRLRQEDFKFEASLIYIGRLFLKKLKTKSTKQTKDKSFKEFCQKGY